MSRRLLSLAALSCLCLTSLFADDKKPNEDGFVSLFDGKSLNGWAGEKDAYKVEEGNIACVQGTAGNLLTEKEYQDFVIRFEFQLTDGANNGLGIRCPMLAKGNLHLDGTELQARHPYLATPKTRWWFAVSGANLKLRNVQAWEGKP